MGDHYHGDHYQFRHLLFAIFQDERLPRPGQSGSINGERVSAEDFVNARHEVELRLFFMNGRWPEEEAEKKDGE